jgi:hypothetical protein
VKAVTRAKGLPWQQYRERTSVHRHGVAGVFFLEFTLWGRTAAQRMERRRAKKVGWTHRCLAGWQVSQPPGVKFVGTCDTGKGDTVTITIDSIFQDEPVDGQGDGSFVPDGMGLGTPTAQVRAERQGGGNGRVYHIGFTAEDGHGGTCSGEILVGVPHNKK